MQGGDKDRCKIYFNSILPYAVGAYNTETSAAPLGGKTPFTVNKIHIRPKDFTYVYVAMYLKASAFIIGCFNTQHMYTHLHT